MFHSSIDRARSAIHNMPDYVKEHVYLPWFTREERRRRARRICLGIGIGMLLAGLAVAAWIIWGRQDDQTDDVAHTPADSAASSNT